MYINKPYHEEEEEKYKTNRFAYTHSLTKQEYEEKSKGLCVSTWSLFTVLNSGLIV